MSFDFTTEFIGLPDFQLSSWEKSSDSLWIAYLEPRSTVSPCPVCHQVGDMHARPGRRLLRHRFIPDWGTVWVSIPILRQRCSDCSLTWTLEWDGIPSRGKATYAFRSMSVNRCKNRDLLSVSKELGVCYTTLERWYYQDSVHQLPTPASVEAPTVVCLDEFAILKGHKYGLHLMDALTGHVWQVTPGRSRQQIQEALRAWPFPAPRVVVTDLAPGMATTVHQIWSSTTVVADKFHVIQLFSKYLEQARKRTTFRGTHKQGRHAQRLLHTPPVNLKEEEVKELETWLANDPALQDLYKALQGMRSVYAYACETDGKQALTKWISTHLVSNTASVRSIAKTIVQWRSEIAAYFTHRYTNARIEGTHNRIKVLKRRAYGYRNLTKFTLRIRLEGKPA